MPYPTSAVIRQPISIMPQMPYRLFFHTAGFLVPFADPDGPAAKNNHSNLSLDAALYADAALAQAGDYDIDCIYICHQPEILNKIFL
jgi:hypothetical protein